MNAHFKRLRADAVLPEYMTASAAGMDLSAAIDQPLVLQPLERAAVGTGWAIALPPGHEGQVRPRSGRALKEGLTVANAPGTIDSDYRGEVKVLLVNLGERPVTIATGDRIAQLVIAPVMRASVREVDALPETDRGAGGFGSTGLVLLALAMSFHAGACKSDKPKVIPVVDAAAVPEPEPEPPPPKPVAKPDAGEEVRGPCPPGMVLANDGNLSVCIDRYEFPGFGQMPVTDVAWDDAEGRCRALEKRLCSEEEWRAACQGPGKTSFPYGSGYEGTACNTSLGRPVAIAASGSFPDCVSASGVFDMSGNVAEWISGGGHTMGGSATDGDDGRCAIKEKKSRPTDPDVGFRCCREPRVGR